MAAPACSGVCGTPPERKLPGALGHERSAVEESFSQVLEGMPEYPHYTRPAEFAGLRAPDVLLNGDHQQIRRWRREQQLRKTLANRPDLLEHAALSAEDRRLLDGIRKDGG